jgi:cupin fold WbuC family metalloprotein
MSKEKIHLAKVSKEGSIIETNPGVFHACAWGEQLEENLIELLVELAKTQSNHKARLCLHPGPDEKLQVTYLSFTKPYSDKIHKHPHKPEVVVPLYGLAFHSIFNNEGEVVKRQLLDGTRPIAISTRVNEWHAIEVESENFVMLEIGTGPFLPTSTIYFIDNR